MGFPRNDFITEATLLGHSPQFITEALKYADVLDGKGLPVIFDTAHLAFMLNMSQRDLVHTAFMASVFYKYFAIKKRSGGYRRIMTPYENLKRIQTWINKHILGKVTQPDYVTAFVAGRSTLMNAKMHEGRVYVLKTDMSNFFESINVRRVCAAFKWMGYVDCVASCLAKLCTAQIDAYKYDQLEEQPEIQTLFNELLQRHEPFLIQGAPTSPALANIVCGRLDKRLKRLSQENGINYSRYADDMTFSADDKALLPKFSLIRKIVEEEGFSLNEKKTHLLHIGNKQMVTGLLVDEHVRVPGTYKRNIMRHIYFCKKYGGRGHFNKIKPEMAFGREWLEGRIRYVQSVEPDTAKKMWMEFEKIYWGC
jgi:retron-type reverse transcriptase